MKQRLFVDTNIMVDLLTHRKPFYEAAAKIFSLADTGNCTIAIASLSFATTAYLLQRQLSYEETATQLRQFATIVEIVSIDDRVVNKSLSIDSGFTDIEDAMQYHAALQSDCDIIVTRNVKDFGASIIPVMTPTDFLKTRE